MANYNFLDIYLAIRIFPMKNKNYMITYNNKNPSIGCILDLSFCLNNGVSHILYIDYIGSDYYLSFYSHAPFFIHHCKINMPEIYADLKELFFIIEANKNRGNKRVLIPLEIRNIFYDMEDKITPK